MQTINWQQFGLKKDPYDTLPLIEGGDLNIKDAFIGREKERNFLDSIFNSSKNICLTICGDVGVGKTSLTNFHKFIWKYNITQKNKLLFSFRREIEATKYLLNKQSFILEIIASVLREIKLLSPELIKNPLLSKLNKIIDFTQSLTINAGISALGFGGDIGVQKITEQPMRFTTATLEEYFSELLKFIKSNKINGLNYEGLIIHVNNFDVVLNNPEDKKQTIAFFNEIRDMLQIPDVYYLFLGPNNFFKDIISTQQRVKSIFYQTPLKISALSKTEILQAFEKRMNLLKSEDVKDFIKPVDDDVIFKLYDLYSGDIRSIMSAIRSILGQYSDQVARTLSVNEAMVLLGKERWENIERMQLTTEQKQLLKFLASSDKFLSQKNVASLLNKARPNISQYYFKPLVQNNIIEVKEEKQRTPYYGLTTDFFPIKWIIESQKRLVTKINEKSNQLLLFSKK